MANFVRSVSVWEGVEPSENVVQPGVPPWGEGQWSRLQDAVYSGKPGRGRGGKPSNVVKRRTRGARPATQVRQRQDSSTRVMRSGGFMHTPRRVSGGERCIASKKWACIREIRVERCSTSPLL